MAAHTPGPWEAASPGDYDTDGIGVFARNPSGLRYYIASVRYMGTAPEMGAEHNARLIAAAPMMYEALQRLAMMPEFDGTSETSKQRVETKRLVRKVLAQVRGGL